MGPTCYEEKSFMKYLLFFLIFLIKNAIFIIFYYVVKILKK